MLSVQFWEEIKQKNDRYTMNVNGNKKDMQYHSLNITSPRTDPLW